MKKVISIQHDTYMMPIHQVIEAIESASNVKVIKITVTDDVLTFHVEAIESDVQDRCATCGELFDYRISGDVLYCLRCQEIRD